MAVPIATEITAERKPTNKEFLVPYISSLKISCPISFVPRRCSLDGLKNVENAVLCGSYVAIIGANNAIPTIIAKIIHPIIPIFLSI